MKNIKESYFKGKENLPSVIFIHGDGQNKTVWNDLEKIMQEKSHTTLSFDLPGHGESKFLENNEYNPISIIGGSLNKRKIKKPIIVGHSGGGLIALQYLMKTKNVSSLILINSLLSNPKYVDENTKLNWNTLKKNYLNLSKENFKKQDLIDYSQLSHLKEKEIRIRGFNTTNPKALENNLNFYEKIKENKFLYETVIPILIISSKKDPFVKEEYLKEKTKKMQNARLYVIEGEHNSLIKNKSEIIKIINENYDFFSGQRAL